MSSVTQKPKIQYIGQFYVYGSEAKALAEQERKKAKSKLPEAKRVQTPEIRVEPLALVSIVMAVVLVATMAVAALDIRAAWQEYDVMSGYVDRLTKENVKLLKEYRNGYNLDEIESYALALGLVPQDQVKTISITLTVPEPAQEPGLWEDIVWFFQGLLA